MKAAGNVWKLFAVRFFQSLIPAYVIERLFWEQRGMTIEMVVYTEIVFAVTVVLLELPTGILADRWSRRNMIALSVFLEGCMFAILLFATEFWHFAAAIFLSGVARTASSGSEMALLYDSLQLNGRESDFEKAVGRLNAVDFISAVMAAMCGSFLAGRFDLELNYWLSVASMLIALAVSMTLVEPTARGQTGESGESIPFARYVRASVRFFRENPGVSAVVLCGVVTGAAINFIYEFWQLYLNRLAIPVVYFGVFSSAIMLLGLPGNMIAHAVKGRIRYRTLLAAVTAVMAAGFVYVSSVKDVTGLAAILVICLLAGLVEPLAAGYLHHRIGDSSMRATIDSFQSLGLNAVTIGFGLGFGYFSSRFELFGGYGFIAVMCCAFFVYFAFASGSIAEEQKP